MPFVTDIVGPQRPVQTWPPLVSRRTAPHQHHRHPSGRHRATPTSTCGPATWWPASRTRWTCSTRSACARTSPTASSTTSPPIRRTTALAQLRAAGSARGSARRSASCFPTRRGGPSLLHLLLDDWVGAALVSGYAVQHAAINLGIEEKLPPGTADNMAGICAGFAADASLVPVRQAQRHHSVGARPGRTAARHRRHARRRTAACRTACAGSAGSTCVRPTTGRRTSTRTSVTRHVDGDGVETIVHEYTVVGSVDASTRTITSVTANVRVLPWQECPGAIGSAARARGNDAVGDA